jgi:hypothetical protein
MDFFFIHQGENGEKVKDYFSVTSWIFIIINLSMIPKTNSGKNINLKFTQMYKNLIYEKIVI